MSARLVNGRLVCPHVAAGCCDDCRAAHRRALNTERARRARVRSVAARAAGLTRCPARIGPSVCGGPLETVVDRTIGRTFLHCPWCDRKARGICRDCPRPVAGKVGFALRCAEHQEAAKAAQIRASRERHRDELNARALERLKDPAVRAQALEYKRAWRKANPDKVRAQKRRAALRQPKRVLDYQKRYRAKHRDYIREQHRRRRRALHPPPAPATCACGALVPHEPPGRPYRTCDTCCWPYQLRQRQAKRAQVAAAAAARAAEQEGAFVAAGRQPKPKKVRRPRTVARTSAAGERLCTTPSCDAIVRGRQKKCAACKAADRELARAALASRQGRGRRTDLERAAGGEQAA